MTKTIFATFSERTDAEEAINKLKTDGFNPKDISIVMKNRKEGEQFAEDTGTDVAGGAVSGATTGAVLGGLAGLLASFVIPGLGAFFIGGPIASALGLTGAAASTVSGAATGAVAGGLLGALMGLGLSEDEARTYEESINEGAILLAIPATDAMESRVTDILNECDADNIKSVVTQEDRIERTTSRTSMANENRDYSDLPTRSYAYAGAKGGKTKTKGRSSGKKGGRSSSSNRGWHGDSEGHSRAAKRGR